MFNIGSNKVAGSGSKNQNKLSNDVLKNAYGEQAIQFFNPYDYAYHATVVVNCLVKLLN